MTGIMSDELAAGIQRMLAAIVDIDDLVRAFDATVADITD
jgi:hypothetical protein